MDHVGRASFWRRLVERATRAIRVDNMDPQVEKGEEAGNEKRAAQTRVARSIGCSKAAVRRGADADARRE